MMTTKSNNPGIKVLSWNINGLKTKLNKDEKKRELLEIFKDYDIVLLQETRIGPKDENNVVSRGEVEDWDDEDDLCGGAVNEDEDEEDEEEEVDEEELNGDEVDLKDLTKTYCIVKLADQQEYQQQTDIKQKTMYMTYFNSRRRGVAILINKPHKYLRSYCTGGDYAWVHVEIDGQMYTFMSVYYHANETGVLMNMIFRSLQDCSKASDNTLVMGGDFNTSHNPLLDAKKKNNKHNKQRKRLTKLMDRAKLLDVWRKLNGEEKEFTYSCRNPKSRLDYVFMKDLKYVGNCKIEKDICLSDHFPVALSVKKYADVETLSEGLKGFNF